jgi:hypothetical protein
MSYTIKEYLDFIDRTQTDKYPKSVDTTCGRWQITYLATRIRLQNIKQAREVWVMNVSLFISPEEVEQYVKLFKMGRFHI